MQNKTNKSQKVEIKSIIIHLDSLRIIKKLNNEQVSNLTRAILAYWDNEQIEIDQITDIIFSPFKNQFDRDKQKYINKVNTNRQNGLGGGRPTSKPKETQDNPLGYSETQDNHKNKNKSNNKNMSKSINNTPAHFLDFSYSFTDYDNVDESIKTITNKDAWVSWQSFNKYIDENCKNIRQISQQMNLNEYLVYRDRFMKSGFISADKLKPMLLKFNNHKPTIEKSISVYPALCSWTENEYKK